MTSANFKYKISKMLICLSLAILLCGCNAHPSASVPSATSVSATSNLALSDATRIPTAEQTAAPTEQIATPTKQTTAPTEQTAVPTKQTAVPTEHTVTPTAQPTSQPTSTPTAEPTPSPTVKSTPTVTAKPTPKPTPQFTLPEASDITTDCGITFAAHRYGMPSSTLSVQQGVVFNMRGTVTSISPLTKVWLTATDSKGNVFTSSVSFSIAQNVTSLELDQDTLNMPSLDSGHVTDNLKNGKCLIELYAQSKDHPSAAVLYSSRFNKISDYSPLTLSPNSFRQDFYSSALAFFKDESAFIFDFTHASGRYIDQDSQWVKDNMVQITDWQNEKIYVHRLAAPYFKQAYQYVSTTFLRVRSDAFDTGVIPLSDVAAVSYGTYNSRFVSGKRFVSHHAFGTAQDINANYPSNTNNKKNHKIIADEVALLSYQGIMTDENGTPYHSFVYNGNCTDIRGKVPETISNYLIYELAFFRAGFCWGYYYDHTCDAMHFSLTELSPSVHEQENGGLRKVYNYQ